MDDVYPFNNISKKEDENVDYNDAKCARNLSKDAIKLEKKNKRVFSY